MDIYLIAAVDDDSVIGCSKSNTIPWHLPADLKRFKALTVDAAVIMGRKTWESLPIKPLPGRLNVVVSKNTTKFLRELKTAGEQPDIVVNELGRAIELAKGLRSRIFIIGGGALYQEALDKDMVSGIFLTRLHLSSGGDVKFPELPAGWVKKTSMDHEDSNINYTCEFYRK